MDGLKFYIEGNEIKLLPQGWKDIQVELSFEDAEKPRISVENFLFATLEDPTLADTEDPVKLINTWNENASLPITDPDYKPGITEGIPYDVKFLCNGQLETVFNGLLDLASSSAKYSCDQIDVPARESIGQDYLNEKARSFRFAYLAKGLTAGDPGFIAPSDYIDIYYQEGRYPEAARILVVAITTYLTLKEIIETIKRIADVAAAIAGGITGLAESLTQLAALIVYLITIAISLSNLITELIDLVFPFVFYHRGMFVNTLVQKACDHMGIGYSSTLLQTVYPRMYIMPAKNVEGTKVGTASTETGYYEGTFEQLLLEITEQLNLQPRLINGTLFVETEDFYFDLANFNLPDMEVEFTGFTVEDIASNYTVGYANDPTDLYSYEDFTGTHVQAQTVNKKNFTIQNSLLRNLTQRQIPYALVNVKQGTSRIEDVMVGLFNAVAALTNTITSLATGVTITVVPPIPSSNLVIKLDTHFTSIPKIGILDSTQTGKTAPATNTTIGAKQLFELYHASRIGKPIFGFGGNQWKKFTAYQIPLCCEDFNKLKDNNYVKYLGNDAKVLSVKWSPYDELADIDFIVRDIVAPNLNVNLIFDGGKSGTQNIT